MIAADADCVIAAEGAKEDRDKTKSCVNMAEAPSPDAGTPPSFDGVFRESLRNLLRWRRDVRHFLDRPVERATVLACLEEACKGPSVGNSQPWRFVFVDSPDARAKVRENFATANAEALAAYHGEQAQRYAQLKLSGLDVAPVQIAVFAELEGAEGAGLGARTMPETKAYSVVAAIQCLWLLLRAEGLGLGWVSIFEPERLASDLKAAASWRFIGYLCIGWPKEEHERPELERAGWQARLPSERFITEV